jgi:hypothetical protein
MFDGNPANFGASFHRKISRQNNGRDTLEEEGES